MELTTRGDRFHADGKPMKLWGVRVASGTHSDRAAEDLIANLGDYQAHGVNALAVFYQGSSGGSQDPFSPDGLAIAPEHQRRMERILAECDRRGMAVVVGLFYQNAPFVLRDAAAVEAAVRTATATLKPFRNVIVNVANEQNSANWAGKRAVYDFREPEKIVALCRVVHETDEKRLVGGGGYDHAKNEVIGRSPHVDALLFDTLGPDVDPDSGALADRFVAAGVTGKPLVNVEQFGAWTKRFVPPGVYPVTGRAPHRREVEAAAARPGLSTFFHSNPWLQGPSLGPGHPLRFDLGGRGGGDDPGIRWYFEHVREKASGRFGPPHSRPG